MKNVLKFIFLFVASITLNSCSKEDEKPTETPVLIGKWEFYKSVTFNTQNQEELIDYNHQCATTKDFMQFNLNNTMNDSHNSSSCQVETNIYSYEVVNGEVKLYNGNSLASYRLKILSLTNSQLKIQWVRNATSKAGTDTYVLIRK